MTAIQLADLVGPDETALMGRLLMDATGMATGDEGELADLLGGGTEDE